MACHPSTSVTTELVEVSGFLNPEVVEELFWVE
jgi:hypothetical protein